MTTALGCFVGFLLWFLSRYLVGGIYTVNQNERAVKTSFGRAQRIGVASTLDDPISESLSENERERYKYPQVRVIQPGGPYFKWPWETVHKASIATETVNIGWDPEDASANAGGTMLEAVTKDQLNTGLTGQLRFRVAERNLYAYLFGIKKPYAHTMGYFVSILRERIANFEAPPASKALGGPLGTLPAIGGKDVDAADVSFESASVIGISINDLRKNLRDLNEHMGRECRSAAARYGVVLEDALITGIDPPRDVESALAAINTAYNQVSSDISLAQAAADQKIVQSRRAVEIETLKAQAEAEPLTKLAAQLSALDAKGPGALAAYVRNVRLSMLDKAQRIFAEAK
jgi:regulator of protease activity HflC (stomatin/prohibitin superfamily)